MLVRFFILPASDAPSDARSLHDAGLIAHEVVSRKPSDSAEQILTAQNRVADLSPGARSGLVIHTELANSRFTDPEAGNTTDRRMT